VLFIGTPPAFAFATRTFWPRHSRVAATAGQVRAA